MVNAHRDARQVRGACTFWQRRTPQRSPLDGVGQARHNTSMVLSPHYRPDPAFERLGISFADPVEPADFSSVTMRWRDDAAARAIGIDSLTQGDWRRHFAEFAPLPDNQTRPLAMRYHGHQFRQYNPQIGDGRGFLFAQMWHKSGKLMDLGTKGSGQTPYSRTGDGRMTLQSGVREVIAGKYLTALGIPSCKILTVFETGEQLTRYDEPSPTRGAVMTRMQHSHVRIGHFQRHAYHDEPDNIRALIDHCAAVYFPQMIDEPEDKRPAAFLRAVAIANAELSAKWMAAGFVHGVLNSDNVTVTGTSFDYGPYRFLPVYAPDYTAAYFDQGGIYAYGRQPEAMAWNLQRLAECLTLISPTEPLETALGAFGEAYRAAIGSAFADRLGLERLGTEADVALASAFTRFAHDSRAPFEAIFFDWFGGDAAAGRAMDGPRARYYHGEAFDVFRNALSDRAPATHGRLGHKYFAQEPVSPTGDVLNALWARIEADDDWSGFHDLITRIDAAGEAFGLAPDAFDAEHSSL